MSNKPVASVPIQINIYNNTTGKLKYVIPPNTITNSKFSTELNDYGNGVFTMLQDTYLESIIQFDDYIEVYVYENGVWGLFETYLFRRLNTFTDNDNINYTLIAGYSLNQLIERRILDVDLDSLGANGYVTIGDTVHNVLTHLANEHFVNCTNPLRNFPNMSIVELNSNLKTVTLREGRKNLFDIFQDTAISGNTNFRIVRTATNALQLQLGNQGSNKTKTVNYPEHEFTLLSPRLGNIKNPTYEINREKEKNYIYLLGEGEGDSQTVTQYGSAQTTLTPYNRIEFVQTYRNNDGDYVKFDGFITRAITLIYDNQFSIDISYKILPEILNVELSLGDKVSVLIQDKLEDLQITEITYTLSSNNELNKNIKAKPYVAN